LTPPEVTLESSRPQSSEAWIGSLKIEMLNHASVIIDIGGLSLLCDPWLTGTCFRNGWGLRYGHPEVLEKVGRATHLWISHFHSDHFHPATLKVVAEKNPNICVIKNESLHFSMRPTLQKLGFTRFLSLEERTPLNLSDEVSVTRYPSTGIDNMLAIKSKRYTVLNYNDCNLPRRALSKIVSRIGPVDVFFCNFNHGHKIFDVESPEEIKRLFRENFWRTVQTVNPRWVIPFASHHYYRSRYSMNQNPSLLSIDELGREQTHLIPATPGSVVQFSGDNTLPQLERKESIQNPFEEKNYGPSIEWRILLEFAAQYRDRIRRQFLGLTFWIPELRIWVEDLKHMLIFSVSKGVFASKETFNKADIVSHSTSLADLFARPFGADQFIVSADFGVVSKRTEAIRRFIFSIDLMDHHLDFRHLIQMIFSLDGIRFLWNRREELTALALASFNRRRSVKVGPRL